MQWQVWVSECLNQRCSRIIFFFNIQHLWLKSCVTFVSITSSTINVLWLLNSSDFNHRCRFFVWWHFNSVQHFLITFLVHKNTIFLGGFQEHWFGGLAFCKVCISIQSAIHLWPAQTPSNIQEGSLHNQAFNIRVRARVCEQGYRQTESKTQFYPVIAWKLWFADQSGFCMSSGYLWECTEGLNHRAGFIHYLAYLHSGLIKMLICFCIRTLRLKLKKREIFLNAKGSGTVIISIFLRGSKLIAF